MNNKIIFLSAVLFSAVMSAQVKIGGTDGTPNSNAMLEVQSTNKGVLLPRVTLSSTTLVTPLTAHVQGMTVYNTATAGDVTPGQYYNDGAKWNRIANSTDIPAVITANNGLTKTGNNIELGGNLDASTTITTTATRDLTFATTATGATGKLKVTGLAATTTAQLPTDKIIVQDGNGVLKTANVSDFATSRNTSVFKAFRSGAWTLLSLGAGWSQISLAPADRQIGATTLLNANGEYVVPSNGIYQIKYEIRMQGVNAGLLSASYIGLIKNGATTPVEQKRIDGVTISLLVLDIANVPIGSTTLDTMLELNAGDRLSLGYNGAINLGLLTDKQVSFYIYKVSDL